MNFGLLGDYDALPDIATVGRGDRGVARGARRARAGRGRRRGGGRRRERPGEARPGSGARHASARRRERARRRVRGGALAVARLVDRDREEAVPVPALDRDADRALGRAQQPACACARRASATARRPAGRTRRRPRAAGRPPRQRSVRRVWCVRRAIRRIFENGGRRSIVRARASAAPASRIPQPRSGVQPAPGRAARGLLEQADDLGRGHVRVEVADERRGGGDHRRRHRRALQVGVAGVGLERRAALARAALAERAGVERVQRRRERAEDARRAVVVVARVGAVGGERDLRAAPGERRAAVEEVRGGDRQAAARVRGPAPVPSAAATFAG